MSQATQHPTTVPADLKVNAELANTLLAMTADELANWPRSASATVCTVHPNRSDTDKLTLTLADAILELRRLCDYLWESHCGSEAARLNNVVVALEYNLAERMPESNLAANAMLRVALDIVEAFQLDPDSLTGRGPAAQLIRQAREWL